MKLAVYTYNSEPYLWYPSPRVSFINLSHGKSRMGSKWKVVDPGFNFRTPMEILPGYDAWMFVDPRVSELAIDFGEFLFQMESLNPGCIYGIGKSLNGFKTISSGCFMEPAEVDRSRELLDYVYKTVLPDNRKYSTQTPLLTFSALLFFRAPKVENSLRDAVDMVEQFTGLNPQVALNWCAWKNTVKIEEIEDVHVDAVHQKIWIGPPVPPNQKSNKPSKTSQRRPITEAKTPTVTDIRRSEQPIVEVHKVEPKAVVPLMVDNKVESKNETPEVKPRENTDIELQPVATERNIQVRGIDHDVLSKLAVETTAMPNPDSKYESDLPNVSVMMTTWNRTALAVKCLKALVENIEYPKDKLYWILADDGSEPGHVEACIDALTESGISLDRIFATRNYRTGENARFGHAINLNNGMRESFKHSEIVLRTEDDLLASQKIPVFQFAKILRDNSDVGGIKLAHGADASRRLPWKPVPNTFEIDASYWNVYIFNHLAMICHKRVYDELGMYNESLSGGQVEADIGKRFMEKFRDRTPYSEYRMKILIPIFSKSIPRDKINWLYFNHIGKESVSGHKHKDKWSEETLKLNKEEVAREIRSEAAKI